MIGKNIKITTKLTLSAAVFILPLAMMFLFIITVSLDSIKQNRRELEGIAALRPVVSLMHTVLQFIKIPADKIPGEKDTIKQDIANSLENFRSMYENQYGKGAFPNILRENWGVIANAPREQALAALEDFIREIRALVSGIGDASGIITDPGLEGSYLADAALTQIPAVYARIVYIENLLQKLDEGTFSQNQYDELQRHVTLLFYADQIRARNVFDKIEGIRQQSSLFEYPLTAYYDALDSLSDEFEIFSIQHTIPGSQSQPIPVWSGVFAAIPAINSAIDSINNAVYRLQNTSFDRLEFLINERIRVHRMRLIQSLAIFLAAAGAAFFIIAVTVLGIKKSTGAVNHVFKRLAKNDLSSVVESASQDELGEVLASLGGFLEKLRQAFVSFNQNASMVSTAVYDLSASAKEITTTAHEQSASVAEIVSTMENSKNLSEQVTVKIVEVADLASRTQELSQRAAELRAADEDMMQDIRDQNAKIIDDIKDLADMLSRIDETVQIIDTIADQTKLIAFNAALEASSSGDAGSRFAVVAGEIRRFADNVAESVEEIKDKISEVQSASRDLISEANNGTKAISTGYARIIERKEVFENIVNVSQNVATKSQQISNLSKQQELATAQIFTALKEISAGVKQFVTATASTSATADNLNTMSVELKETLAKYQTR
ncbi:MAG: hypothetical protein Pg6C_12340 [Treponemataceae bacterium]|nr:MAG: hypothetical protein Pg6C_12340 [Treponemataceae bacterium]